MSALFVFQFHIAVPIMGKRKLLDYYWQQGADFNVKAAKGMTALAVARQRVNTAIEQLLEQAGEKSKGLIHKWVSPKIETIQ